MMYRILYNKTEIYGNDLDQAVLNPTLEVELNAAGRLEFTLPVTRSDSVDTEGKKIFPDTIWNTIQVFNGEVEVWEGDDCIFFGRPLEITRDWNNQKKVVCEGALAYFNDTIQETKEYKQKKTPLYTDTVKYPDKTGFFNQLIANHNDQMMKDNQYDLTKSFEVGECDLDNPLVWRKTDMETTASCLQSMCLDSNGGYFILRKELVEGTVNDYKNVIEWRKHPPYGTSQEIIFGLNLLEITQDLNGSDICTVLYPTADDDLDISKADKHEENNPYVIHHDPEDHREDTHIYHDKSAKYMVHKEGYEKYGRVVKQKSFDLESDGTEKQKANELFQKAAEWLDDQNWDETTIECSAADLHYVWDQTPYYDEAPNKLGLGQTVRVTDEVHNVVRDLPIFKISMNLDSGVKRITMGTPPKKELTDIIKPSTSSSTRNTTGGNSDSGGSSSGSSGGGGSVSIPVKDVQIKTPGSEEYASTVKKKIAKIDLDEAVLVADVKVDGSSVVDENKVANIEVPVKDVKVDNISVVDEHGFAQLDSDDFGKVDDVRVDNQSVVNNKIANINIRVKDVKVGNQSVVDQQGSANINIPVKDVKVDGESVVDQNGFAQLDSDDFGKVDDVRVDGESVVTNKIAELDGPYINYPNIEIIADIDNTNSSYSYSDEWRSYRINYRPDEHAPGAYLIICLGRELPGPAGFYIRMHRYNSQPTDPTHLKPIEEISKDIYHGYYKNNQNLGYSYSVLKAALFNNVGITNIEDSHFIDIRVHTADREPTVNTAWGMTNVPNYLFRILVCKINGLGSGVCGKFLDRDLYGFYNDQNEYYDNMPPTSYRFDDEINSSEIFLHYLGILGGYNTHVYGRWNDHPYVHMKNIRNYSDFLPWPQYNQKQSGVTIDRSTKDTKPRQLFPLEGVAVENQQDVDPPYYFNVTCGFFGIHLYVNNSSGGTDVEANPSGTPTDDLETIRIGETIYDIPGSSGSGGTLFMSDYYSTEERVVGAWTDGKPLYQKTWDFSSNPINLPYNVWTFTGINSTNMESLVSSIVNTANTTISDFIGQVNLSADNRNEVAILRTWNDSRTRSLYRLTLQYTKVSDTPGTAPTPGNIIYLPSLYSYEEREIGVWSDGKPLYQRSYDLGTSGIQISSSSWTDTTISKGDISEIINCIGIAPNGASKSLVATVTNSSNNVISLQTPENSNKTVRYFTIQYTKTTDTPGSGTWSDASRVATDADIAQLQSNFQDGVDDIYDACVAKGSTPASHSLSDVVQGIMDISGGGGDTIRFISSSQQGPLNQVSAISTWDATGLDFISEVS